MGNFSSEDFEKYIDVIVTHIVIKLLCFLFIFTCLIITSIVLVYMILPEEVFSILFKIDSFSKPPTTILISWICISFSSLTLSLWVFHTISVITIKDTWIVKAIWVTGFSSILATTASVYAHTVTVNAEKPLEGLWYVKIVYNGFYVGSDLKMIETDSSRETMSTINAIVSWNSDLASYDITTYGNGPQIKISEFNLGNESNNAVFFFPSSYKSSNEPNIAKLVLSSRPIELFFRPSTKPLDSKTRKFDMFFQIGMSEYSITFRRTPFN